MPTYDYKCIECGRVIEQFHAMTGKPKIKECVCGAKLKKQIGAGAGLIFRGDGFYRTCDYINQKAKEDGLTHGGFRRQKANGESL